MAVLVSDDFDGLADNVSVAGRTANNALGGSLSLSWLSISSANMVGDGTGRIRGANDYRNARLSISGLADLTKHRVRARWTPNGTHTSVCITSLCTNGADNNATNAIYALLGSSGTALRVREGANQNWSGGTNRATLTVSAVDLSTYYWLELERDGLLVWARIRNDDLSVRNEVSWEFSSLPTGSHVGLGLALSGTAARFSDFVVEDLTAEPPPPPAGLRRRAVWW